MYTSNNLRENYFFFIQKNKKNIQGPFSPTVSCFISKNKLFERFSITLEILNFEDLLYLLVKLVRFSIYLELSFL